MRWNGNGDKSACILLWLMNGGVRCGGVTDHSKRFPMASDCYRVPFMMWAHLGNGLSLSSI